MISGGEHTLIDLRHIISCPRYSEQVSEFIRMIGTVLQVPWQGHELVLLRWSYIRKKMIAVGSCVSSAVTQKEVYQVFIKVQLA
mgnify:CR=1 FL=1